MRNLIISISLLLALLTGLSVSAQNSEQKDSLVVLLSSQSAQMVDIKGNAYRKVIGPARFLHNNTYLLCDTALWNVDTRVIEAWGNVSILQEQTVLKSDKLTYLIDSDLAQFRGSIVQLTDKDHNTLRTRYLDYNTKDSVAIFSRGGAMRDKDGQIIESMDGTYDSKQKQFTFRDQVNMFTDSIFVKTNTLVYDSPKNTATFGFNTNAWKDENMLSSDGGWYDRGNEIFLFRNNVHVMSDSQEGWCDSLYFYRNTSDVEMLGHAQVTDTTRNVYSLAGRIHYLDSLSQVTMTRKPAVITETEEKGVKDTIYLGAERLIYYAIPMYKVDSLAALDAKKRLETLNIDPVGAFRKKAAEEAAKAAEEEAKKDPNYRPQAGQGAQGQAGKKPSATPPQSSSSSSSKSTAKPSTKTSSSSRKRASEALKSKLQSVAAETGLLAVNADSLKTHSDSIAALTDSLMVKADSLVAPVDSVTIQTDSLSVLADSLTLKVDSLNVLSDSLGVVDSIAIPEPPKDTTRIGFLEAIRNVRIYRKDIQVVCDSLLYSDLDSLARMYIDPVIWQEKTRQYSSDSLYVVVRNNGLDKASLMSNAFIAIQEDTTHYNQIKSAEMMAYFDNEGGLRRFDALGGAASLFYIEENGVLATVNKTDSKMMSANFKDGEIQRIYYFEQAKNDGYPVVQLSKDERLLKGFSWQEERRPADRNAVTPLELRPSQRKFYEARPRATFKQTNIYFPRYMTDIYRQIEVRDSLRKVRERQNAIAKREAEAKAHRDSIARADSLATSVDSLTVAVDSLKQVEDNILATPADTSVVVRDSQAVAAPVAPEKVLTPEEIKAAKKAEAQRKKEAAKAAKEAEKQKRQAEKEKRWADLDQRDADKLKKKEEKKLNKLRAKKRKALEEQARHAAKDAEYLEKYRQKYEREKASEKRKHN